MRFILVCIALVGVLIAGWALKVSAAGSGIAVMMSSDQSRYHEAHRSFIKSMIARGYSQQVGEILVQTPNPDQLSWSNTVRKFNAYRPRVIVAYGAPAANVAMKESDGIPVVSVDYYALSKPVKGICGVSSRVPVVTLLKTLQDIKPFRRVGILYSGREAGSQRQAEDIRRAVLQLGATVLDGHFATSAALDAGLNGFIDKVDVVIATESSIVYRALPRIIERAKSHSVPVVSTIPDAAEKGALLSLEINPQEQGHLAAEIVVRILEGASPEHLSLLMPKRIDLILNMRMARELGITPSFSVLNSATRVIK